jgi:pimeloyl-ACP methyl ester carboxylesterase
LRSTLRSGDIVLFENDLPDTYDEGANGGNDAGVAPAPGRAFVTIDGIRTAYRERGARTHHPPAVILHGWGASSAAVTSIQACLEGDRRTIALDLPGFGDSDPPSRPWGSADYAVHLRASLQTLGVDRADLIGHSHGGRVAINLVATWPEMVRRLVLVDSAGIPPRRGPKYRARMLAFKAGRRAVSTLPSRERSGVQEWFATRFGSEDYRQAGAMRATLVRVVNEDVRPLLSRIEAPTLLIWGEHDDATPVSDGRIMERLIPDAGLVVFPGAGHFAYADDPGRFCRVVGHFLRG